MARTPPQSRIQWIILAGSSITAVATGGALALTQDKRIFVPLVALGIVLRVVRVFWRWESSPQRDEIRNLIHGNGCAIHLFMLGLCIPLLAFLPLALFGTYLEAPAHPCLCPSQAGGKAWLNLTAGAWAGSFMLTAILCAAFVMLLGLLRLRRGSK
jgi:hypothetical protein